jgi:flavin-dependent dehydrogenase
VTGRIAIVGAGPGGLVAAIASRRLGLDAIV